MNTLEHDQLLQHEYNLLNQPGSSLSNFCLCEYNPLFLPPPSETQKYLSKSYRVNTKLMKTAGTHSNSIFQVFSTVLLKIFYDGERNLDMLQHLKCILYAPDLQFDKLQACPNRHLSTIEMKKLVVEFFEVMRYGKQEVEIMLARYPIILEIFCVFLRTILAEAGMKKLIDWRESGDPGQILMVLCDYLDVDYQMNKDVYFLNDGEFFVYISEDGKDIVFGLYKLDRSGAPSREKNRLSQDFDFNLGESQTMGNPEIFPSKDMPTPCFNQFHEDEWNFNAKTSRSLKQSHKKAIQEICEEEQDIEDAKKGLMLLLGPDEPSDNEELELEQIQPQETPKKVNSPPDVQSPFSTDIISGSNNQTPFSNLSQIAKPNISASIRLDNSQHITMMKKQFSHEGLLGDQNRMAERSKSDFYFGQRGEKSEKVVRGATEASFISCLCTQNKMSKNILQSNVINLSIEPPEGRKQEAKLKKVLSNPGKTSKKQFMKLTTKVVRTAPRKGQNSQTIKYNKIPEFLKRRNTTVKREKTEPSSTSNGVNNDFGVRQKISFTYQAEPQTITNKSNYQEGTVITMKNSQSKNLYFRTEPTSYSTTPKKAQNVPLREHQRMPSAVIGGGFANCNYGVYNAPQKRR